MGTSISKRIELFANVATILVALLLAFVVIKNFILTGPPAGAAAEFKTGGRAAPATSPTERLTCT